MTVRNKLASLAIGLPLLAFAGIPADAQQSAGGADAEYMARAMAAAPSDIVRDATIVRMVNGAMQTLKIGTNEFTCMVANNGPMCAAPIGMEWAHAWQTRAPPPNKLGFIYMLNGDRGMSNTDPWATRPLPGNHWVMTGPHVMMVGLPVMKMSFPRMPDPDRTNPYVMWSGTLYEHVMLPLNPANLHLVKDLRDAARLLNEAANNISDPSLIQTSREMRSDANILLANLSNLAP